MALNFPNPSRSFDAARNGVRFTGHDGLFEVSFLVEAAALAKSESGRPDDPGMDTVKMSGGTTMKIKFGNYTDTHLDEYTGETMDGALARKAIRDERRRRGTMPELSTSYS